MKKTLLILAAVLVAAAVLAPTFASAQAPAAAPAAAPAKKAVLKAGDKAPDFELAKLGGGTFKLSQFLETKKKAVVLATVQSACASCRAELGLLNSMVGKPNFDVFMLNVDAKGGTPNWEKLMASYMEESGLKMDVLIDPKMSVPRMFGINVTPGMIIIDKGGVIADIRLGYDAEDAAEVSKKLGELK